MKIDAEKMFASPQAFALENMDRAAGYCIEAISRGSDGWADYWFAAAKHWYGRSKEDWAL